MAYRPIPLLVMAILLCDLSGKHASASYVGNVAYLEVDNIEKVAEPVFDEDADTAEPMFEEEDDVPEPMVDDVQPIVLDAMFLPDDVLSLKPESSSLHSQQQQQQQTSKKRCPVGYVKWMSKCYFLSKDKLNWFDSMTMCKMLVKVKGQLLEIGSKPELTFVAIQIKSRGAKGEYWLGASDFQNHTEFRWLSSRKKVNSTFWAPHEPSHTGGWERCMEITKDGMTNDDACRAEQYFICSTSAFQFTDDVETDKDRHTDMY